jgi:hypothetical protein
VLGSHASRPVAVEKDFEALASAGKGEEPGARLALVLGPVLMNSKYTMVDSHPKSRAVVDEMRECRSRNAGSLKDSVGARGMVESHSGS